MNQGETKSRRGYERIVALAGTLLSGDDDAGKQAAGLMSAWVVGSREGVSVLQVLESVTLIDVLNNLALEFGALGEADLDPKPDVEAILRSAEEILAGLEASDRDAPPPIHQQERGGREC